MRVSYNPSGTMIPYLSRPQAPRKPSYNGYLGDVVGKYMHLKNDARLANEQEQYDLNDEANANVASLTKNYQQNKNNILSNQALQHNQAIKAGLAGGLGMSSQNASGSNGLIDYRTQAVAQTYAPEKKTLENNFTNSRDAILSDLERAKNALRNKLIGKYSELDTQQQQEAGSNYNQAVSKYNQDNANYLKQKGQYDEAQRSFKAMDTAPQAVLREIYGKMGDYDNWYDMGLDSNGIQSMSDTYKVNRDKQQQAEKEALQEQEALQTEQDAQALAEQTKQDKANASAKTKAETAASKAASKEILEAAKSALLHGETWQNSGTHASNYNFKSIIDQLQQSGVWEQMSAQDQNELISLYNRLIKQYPYYGK